MSERMNPMASIMWDLGQFASLRMVVGNLIILDRPPEMTMLAERLASVAARASRLRQRPVAGRRARTQWVNEEVFDATRHLRTMAAPSPGDLRQILDLVALLESSPFDADVSPWDITIVEGLERGRVALYMRAHHSLTDGLHGVSLVRLFLDEVGSSTADEASGSGRSTTADPVDTPAALTSSTGSSRRKPGTVSVTIDLAGAVQPIARGLATGASY